MATIKIKGHEINTILIRDSFNRRAQRIKNNIILTLKAIGLTEDDILLDLEPVAIKRLPASVSWYLEGQNLHFTYKGCTKYVENLHVVSKVIEFEVLDVLEGRKTIEEFIRDFREEDNVEEERQAARKFLGVEGDSLDFDLMNKNYKKMAKELHPDMPTGDTEKFKELNRAHKILKRELV